ncbi:addiction module protein [Chondromyces crocatus]|uniref:Addiction module protein n=1 Tax=Chondromyces crocatus TaxID=52 RepID=A0A0K1EQ48_CHOCO|nr:uncharacterized protein CMC5_069990 [Chondromyces crocatus]
MSSRRTVLAQALELPCEERADMARSLLRSLDEPADKADVEDAWLDEVGRRLQSVEQGTATTDSWEAVRQRVHARLRASD